jgi:hypothetical protein
MSEWVENLLNNNKLILLVCVVFANLSNKVMEKELEQFEDKDHQTIGWRSCFNRNHYLVRKIAIFAMTYVFTRDFKLAFILALLFFLMNDLK